MKNFDPSQVPSVRTVSDILKEKEPPADPSGNWTLASAEPDDIGLVMPVLAAVAYMTEGKRKEITNTEALEVARLRRAAPGLPLIDYYTLARLYLVREARREPTTDIDLYLSFAPWNDEDSARRYAECLIEGWIPALPGVGTRYPDNPDRREELDDYQTMVVGGYRPL